MCVSACVQTLWISVSLHNKSLLNKCKADGTVVSPPCGGKEREKRGEGKGGGGNHTPTPNPRLPQTHSLGALHRR